MPDSYSAAAFFAPLFCDVKSQDSIRKKRRAPVARGSFPSFNFKGFTAETSCGGGKLQRPTAKIQIRKTKPRAKMGLLLNALNVARLACTVVSTLAL